MSNRKQIKLLVVAALLMIGLGISSMLLGDVKAQEGTSPIYNVIIDDFSASSLDDLHWQTFGSEGAVTVLQLDNQTNSPSGIGRQSLKIETSVPCVTGRNQRIQRNFSTPQDWGGNDILEFWIRGDGIEDPAVAGALTITINETDGEIWQSSRSIGRSANWRSIRINLSGNGIGDPWQHAEDFVIPQSLTNSARNQVLDLDNIAAISITSMTVSEWACGTAPETQGQNYPSFTLWVDQIGLRQAGRAFIDGFEYAPNATLPWQLFGQEGAITLLQLDRENVAPGGISGQALKIDTLVPCSQGRNQRIQRPWTTAQDWSNSSTLEFWVRGDGLENPAIPGVLTVTLIDSDYEIWQSTRSVSRSATWRPIVIELSGAGIGDPWMHPNDFVIPTGFANSAKNQSLDTNAIQSISITMMSVNEWACGTAEGLGGEQYPNFTLWLDHLIRR